VLREVHGRESDRDERRRWFSDDDFDLIVWLAEDGAVAALQLCYDKARVERAVTWSGDDGYGHPLVRASGLDRLRACPSEF
jgi:hypothetical protein